MYDLNISWTPSMTPQDLERMLAYAAHLGYHTVALSHTIPTPLPNEINHPLPNFPSTPHPTQPPTTTTSSSISTTTSPESTKNKLPPQSNPKLPTILHRATLPIADLPPNHRLASLTHHYHLLALRPTTEKALTATCLTAADSPLVSLDLTQRLPFLLRPKLVMAAVARGVRFEICYAHAIAAPDPRARATFISNVTALVRASKGRGLVVSSGAAAPLHLRAPVDVVNLLAVWGLGAEKGGESLGVVSRGVVVNEGLQRRGFRGVVEVVRVVPGGPERAGGKDGKDGKNEGQKTEGRKKKNKKRKGELEAEAAEQRPGKKTKRGEEMKG